MQTIHPQTESLLSRLKPAHTHPLLFTGAPGSDFNAAITLLQQSLSATLLPIDSGSYASAKEVRELYELTRTSPEGMAIVALPDADSLSHAAQNALLKLLEEPPRGYLFVLTTTKPDQLLSTVRSRLQTIHLLPITDEQSESLLDTLGVTDATFRRQLLFIGNGHPKELERLVADKDYFAHKATIMRDARTLLQAKSYDKIVIAHSYRENRDDAATLLQYSISLVIQTLGQKPSSNLLKKLDQLTTAFQSIVQNGNLRLALLAVMV